MRVTVVLAALALPAVGRPEPPNDRTHDLQLRLDDWLRGERAVHDAQVGRVDPVWRDVQRGIAAAFKPTVRMVTDADPLSGALGQVRGFLRNIDKSPQPDDRFDRLMADEVRLERAYEEEPASWQRTEVEAVVEVDGRVRSTRVVARSGRPALDDAALAAVERALQARPRPARPTTVRFAVEAGVIVQPPTATRAAGDPRGTGVVASLKLKFDEATGRIEPRLWFTRRVVTRVRVVRVETR